MIRAILRNAGFNPRRLISAIKNYQRYTSDRHAFKNMPGADLIPWGREMPILTEREESSGGLGGYFFQDCLVARWIYDAAPERHVDVGSRIDGFLGSVSIFRKLEVIDIRPQPLTVPNVTFHALNVMDPLPMQWIEATDCLSCLHTIEHFGLGRYGDPLDPQGHLKGLEQLKKMVAPGGLLILSTPLGPERVEFNAHRVFSAQTLVGWFADGWNIEKCAVIDDLNHLTEAEDAGLLLTSDCQIGIGIIAARKSDSI